METVGKLFSDRAKPNLEANLPAVINELAAVDLADRQMIAMALATVRVETSQFLPVSELPSGYKHVSEWPSVRIVTMSEGDSEMRDLRTEPHFADVALFN